MKPTKTEIRRTRVRAVRHVITPDEASDLLASLGPTLTREEAARVTGVSSRTIDRWRKRRLVSSRTLVNSRPVDPMTPREFVALDTASVLAMITREVASRAERCASCEGTGEQYVGGGSTERCADCRGILRDGPCGATS
jgi:hypothetical protein